MPAHDSHSRLRGFRSAAITRQIAQRKENLLEECKDVLPGLVIVASESELSQEEIDTLMVVLETLGLTVDQFEGYCSDVRLYRQFIEHHGDSAEIEARIKRLEAVQVEARSHLEWLRGEGLQQAQQAAVKTHTELSTFVGQWRRIQMLKAKQPDIYALADERIAGETGKQSPGDGGQAKAEDKPAGDDGQAAPAGQAASKPKGPKKSTK